MLWLLELQIKRGRNVYMQLIAVNRDSRTSNYQSSLFLKKYSAIQIFCVSGWIDDAINPDKRRSTVLNRTVSWSQCRKLLKSIWLPVQIRIGHLPDRRITVWANLVCWFVYLTAWLFPCRSQWPRGLRRRSSAARLLGLLLRIPSGEHG